MVFLTLEDEAGLIDVIVYPRLFQGYRRLLRSESLLMVTGEVQQADGVVTILAGQIERLPD